MRIKRTLMVLCSVSALALAGVSSSVAANNSHQTGLVNVSLGDVSLLNNVNLAVAANVAATVCDVSVPVSVLATQFVGDTGMTVCQTGAGPLTVDQAQNGAQNGGGGPSAGGNNSQQAGLINLSLGDVNVLNNANIAVAANVAATVCDVTVPVALLSLQAVGDTATTLCHTTAGDLTATQGQ
jgi:hypothetical protein